MKIKKMAIMKNVSFGLHDRAGVALSFNLYISECVATTEYLQTQQSIDLIKSYAVADIQSLNGKPCWVEHDEEKKTVHYLGPLVINDNTW